jgi:hypothetical protein
MEWALLGWWEGGCEGGRMVGEGVLSLSEQLGYVVLGLVRVALEWWLAT